MSALANNFKTKFAGLLRGMLRRVDGNESVGLQPLHPPPLPGAVAPAPIQQTAQAQFSPAVAPTAPTPTQTANMSEIEMPLLPILERLPADLRAKWLLGGMDLSQATISISAEKVLPQLALGAVKITFGELRNAAPSLFRNGEEYDSLPIVLPLNEVLSRLHPALIARAPKRTVAVPTDIASPFGLNGQGASLSAPPPKTPTTHFYKKAPPTPSEPIKMPSPPAVAAQPLPFVPRNNVPATPAPLPRVNRSSQVFQAPPPARPSIPSIPAPAAAAPVPPAPVSPISPISSIPAAPVQFTPPTPSAPKPAAIPARPVVPPRPATPSRPMAPAATPAAAPEAPGILAPLAALSENWPESLRLEIIQSNLGNSRVALPVHLIEPALKRGRVIFPWQHVRSWLRPTSAGPSIHDATELELPLQVLAPLFLPTKKTEVKPQVKAQLPPSSVPNLFFGFPQPQPEELAAPVVTPLAPVNPIAAPIAPINPPQEEYVDKTLDQKLAETNYYVFGEGGAPQVDETDYKRPMAPATDFSTRRAMPKEIIDRTVKLPGVAGAIIALPDGLKVSYSLPPELNADTVAAFLPQLFSRVSQCSKELRMGELNNLNFTIGNIPWKIFRVNAVYFAAFGRAGQPLPTAQLAIMASELDRKK